ncbi:MAG: dTDP-4-dehydrorhamnose 3,5-epimerase [Blastocatellia bacterium]|nr:dTDP-4-dehydrorhamnose 3,5-epimerase [Blastocatellia bacterium]
MIFRETKLAGVFLIELEPHADERGFFARSFCRSEFAAKGLNPNLVQCNISYNRQRGTLRGIHFQAEPYPEAKLVRCTAGALFDVVVDLRPDSPTFKTWYGVELSAANRLMLYIPPGCGHGFQSLADDTEVFYQMSEMYHPEAARGVRWNDPVLGIVWPLAEPVISQRDQTLPGLDRF